MQSKYSVGEVLFQNHELFVMMQWKPKKQIIIKFLLKSRQYESDQIHWCV